MKALDRKLAARPLVAQDPGDLDRAGDRLRHRRVHRLVLDAPLAGVVARSLLRFGALRPRIRDRQARAGVAGSRRCRAIPGVVEVEPRVVRDAQLSIEGVSPPMIARLIGADFAHLPGMNRLTLRSGRWPTPGARGEVVVNQRFLQARSLALGDRVQVLLNGKLERFTLVGTALTARVHLRHARRWHARRRVVRGAVDRRRGARRRVRHGRRLQLGAAAPREKRLCRARWSMRARQAARSPTAAWAPSAARDQMSHKILSAGDQPAAHLSAPCCRRSSCGGGVHPERGARTGR